MDEILVRKATAGDLEVLFQFEQNLIGEERPYDETLKPGDIHYYDIRAMIDATDVELVVADLNGEVIGSGFARIENAKPYLRHAQHAWLGFMYVVPAHRGKGINQKIISALKQWAVERNITEVRLAVYDQNEKAIKAYGKAGFTKNLVEMRMKIERITPNA
jgi:GNAT superfamily N-acetyltransferase